MRFLIDALSKEYPPLPGAKRIKVSTTQTIPSSLSGEWWFNDGESHRDDGKESKREMDVEMWVLDIKSIEDLEGLLRAEGPLTFDIDEKTGSGFISWQEDIILAGVDK